MKLVVNRAESLSGQISVPGDKSISHRSVMMGALAEGVTNVTGFLAADDCISTMQCFKSLGVEIESISDTQLRIYGSGIHGLSEPEDVLNVGNSGTTLRILPGILAGQEIFTVLTGDESIRRRPTGRVVEPLRKMGAKIQGRDNGFLAPIAITGSQLKGINFSSTVSSAQVKTSLLFAGLMAKGLTTLKEPSKSRDHTERMLKLFGADLVVNGTSYSITGKQKLKAHDIDVPGDISSAAFFMVAALIVGNSEISIENVGINETRTGIMDILKSMSADITFTDERVESNEPRATINVKSSALTAESIKGEIIPRLIDEIPIIAVAATQAKGKTVIKEARELRVKESDRIAALCEELRKMGAEIEELEDGMIVYGPTPLNGATVKSHGDHRIAMSLAIAGLVAEGETIIEDSDCINISYPRFEETLNALIGK
jgi:3-phosphoshikimate 1-carboxyvinyltransferase